MASLRQLKANRRNARKSTGPKTPEGKARSSRNAFKHGCAAGDLVLTYEEKEEDLLALTDHWFDHFQPVGALEAHYVKHIAVASWRLQRLWRMETGYLDKKAGDINCEDYEAKPGEERIKDNQLMGNAMMNAFLPQHGFHNFTRYEARLQRNLDRAIIHLHQLQLLRAASQPVANTQLQAIPEPKKQFLPNKANPKIGHFPPAVPIQNRTPNPSLEPRRLPPVPERLE
jgi:hypothetical protein